MINFFYVNLRFVFTITLVLVVLIMPTVHSPFLRAFGDYDASSPVQDGGSGGGPAIPFYHVDWSKRYPELDFHLVINPATASVPSTANQESPSQQMTLRLFNSQTNETVKWITFTMNVSRVVEDGGNRTNETEFEVLPPNAFQSQDGLRTFLIKPSVVNNETTISLARQEPVLNAWTPEPGKPIVINDSELLKNGKYHARIEFIIVDYPTAILEEGDTLVLDVYWTVDNSHIDPSIKNQVIASTVVAPTKMPEFQLPAMMMLLGISVIGIIAFTVFFKKWSTFSSS